MCQMPLSIMWKAPVVSALSLFTSAYRALELRHASNAFNALNHQAALRNVSILCPIIAPFLINAYHTPSKLFIRGTHILSQEGITQGDPLGTVIFTIGTLPLICQIQGGVQQAWYDDHATAGGH